MSELDVGMPADKPPTPQPAGVNSGLCERERVPRRVILGKNVAPESIVQRVELLLDEVAQVWERQGHAFYVPRGQLVEV